MELDSLQTGSGEELTKRLSLTLEYSIPMLLLTDMVHSHPATENMNKQKRMYEQRCREVEHSSFTLLVLSATGGLAKEATYSTKDWPYCLPPNGIRPTATVCAGCNADLAFHCYVLPPNQSEEQGPHMGTPSKSQLQLTL